MDACALKFFIIVALFVFAALVLTKLCHLVATFAGPLGVAAVLMIATITAGILILEIKDWLFG